MFKRFAQIVLPAVLVIACAAPSLAVEPAQQLDSEHSIARLYLISADGSISVNVGVARVIGGANPYSSEPVFNFIIYPEDMQAQPMASAQTDNSTAHYANINFQSRRTVQANDGSLEVTGDLILTRIERPVIVNPNEAYAGAEYGDPIVRTVSQEVMFVMVPAIATGRVQNDSISATTLIRRETFPELLSAILHTNWPLIVHDKKCEMPSTMGEGYYGPLCSGTTAMIENGATPVTVGEDYPGFEAFTREWSDIRIRLDLKLSQNT